LQFFVEDKIEDTNNNNNNTELKGQAVTVTKTSVGFIMVQTRAYKLLNPTSTYRLVSKYIHKKYAYS